MWPFTRSVQVQDIAEILSKRDVAGLIRAARSPEETVRRAAVAALEDLLPTLHRGDSLPVADEVFSALDQLGPEGLGLILGAAHPTGSPLRRKAQDHAIQAVKISLPAVLAQAESTSISVRAALAEVLQWSEAGTRHPPALEVLGKLLRDPALSVRKPAAGALAYTLATMPR